MIKKKIEALSSIFEYTSEDSDILELGRKKSLEILFSMRLIRHFEEKLLSLQEQSFIWGGVHTSIGVEGSAAAALSALGKGSKINTTHRGHHHTIGKFLQSFNFSNVFHIPDHSHTLYQTKQTNRIQYYGDKAENSSTVEELVSFLRSMFSEIMGLKTGCCSGRGGSMHLYYPEYGMYGSNGIVGGGLPAAAGLALGCKHNEQKYSLQKNSKIPESEREIIMTFFGDGAANQGVFLETCNLAGIYNLPIIFYLENNQYAVGTKYQDVCSVEKLAERGAGYGFPSIRVMGDDIAAVYAAVEDAGAAVRNGEAPYLIEAVGYRPFHHDSPLRGSAYGYRTRDEEDYWESLNAYDHFPEILADNNLLLNGDLELIDRSISEIMEKSLEGVFEHDVINENLWPNRNDLLFGVRSTENEFAELTPFSDADAVSEKGKVLSYVDAIASATANCMSNDDSVFEWGEDVANFRKGPYGASKGLKKKFPDRILNTPISEAGFIGMALGASMAGLKPIVEIMFPDFSLVAADQLFNQIAKARYMYGGKVEPQIVVRTRIAAGTGMGPQHSMDIAGLFSLFSGWRIIAPATPSDYVGLFNTAIMSRDPVLILEHHRLYSMKAYVPDIMYDRYIPFSTAEIIKEGRDITCITYGGMVPRVREAAEILQKQNISLEIIDLRFLDSASIDYRTILNSLKKTKACFFIEEPPESQGIGRQVLFEVLRKHEETRRSFDEYVRFIPRLLSSADVPMPVSRKLEAYILLETQDIVDEILEFMNR